MWLSIDWEYGRVNIDPYFQSMDRLNATVKDYYTKCAEIRREAEVPFSPLIISPSLKEVACLIHALCPHFVSILVLFQLESAVPLPASCLTIDMRQPKPGTTMF